MSDPRPPISVTLDSLFQRNAAAHPASVALCDLPHADSRASRSLNYTEAAAAVDGLCDQFRAIDLPPKSVIALHLPNGVELAISLLAIMRAGHVAVPVPVLWRKSDLVRALQKSEASALITTAKYAHEDLPSLAMEAASEVFELSYPCAFGENIPDGVLALALETTASRLESARSSAPAEAAFITIDAIVDGIDLAFRGDAELLASGLGPLIAADIHAGDIIVASVPIYALAGLASAFVPWLLTGGALYLAQDLPSAIPLESGKRGHFITPARYLSSVAAAADVPIASYIAVHRDGGTDETDLSRLECGRIVDLHVFGEAAAIAVRRTSPEVAAPLPLGPVFAGSRDANAPMIVEIATKAEGEILVRGPMLPHLQSDQHWVATGFIANVNRANQLNVMAPPEDIVTLGGLRFGAADLERRIRAIVPEAQIAAVADPLLGARLAIWSDNPEATSRSLLAAGLPRIIAASVLKADGIRAAS